MREIKVNNEVYAILVSGSPKDGSEWIGNPIESLQAQRMKYSKGEFFKVHHHILNPRTIKRTQEAFIVISGKIAVDMYDNGGEYLGVLEAVAGDAIFVYRGGHGVRVLEDFVGYECKAGQFTYVSEDKEYKDVRKE